MSSKFFFGLSAIKPQTQGDGGSYTEVTASEVPGFVQISYANLTLKKNGSTEPVWHPDAGKIGYCTQGRVLVDMRTPAAAETFTVKKGEMFFIPQGFVHHIENLSAEDAIIQFAYNHPHPNTMFFSKAIDSISDSVFQATFDTPAGFVDGLKKAKGKGLIQVLPKAQNISQDINSKYKFNIEDSGKPVLTKGGFLQLGTKSALPVLQGLGILGFGLNPQGVVEPHWHTNAGELVFIVKGSTRITVLSPDGTVDVMEVHAGEGAFAPASHFHNIENIGKENVEVIAFFSDENPDYIGVGEVLGSYPNELLASIFHVSPDYFASLKKPDKPLIIVPL